MIVSGYTLDLYCDHPNHESTFLYSSSDEGYAQFTSDAKNPKTDAYKQAKKVGWKIDLKKGICICPKCRKKF